MRVFKIFQRVGGYFFLEEVQFILEGYIAKVSIFS